MRWRESKKKIYNKIYKEITVNARDLLKTNKKITE